uniref:Uncharacterized protein n=1 Tax=Ralstonia solanacearum TaxID=305 RepID=A0A0S4TYR5_RALSL|nr:protein of unknown function [Ralstonia solanacearum]
MDIEKRPVRQVGTLFRFPMAATGSQLSILCCERGVFGGALGRFQRVDQQHGDGHRTDAARHGRDMAGHALDAGEVDIAAQLAGIVAVHAHVDDDRARLDHVSRDDVAAADGGHDDVGLAGVGGQIARLAVADGDGGAGLQQQHRHRLADDVRGAHHHGTRAAHRVVDRFEHLHAAVRRARTEQRRAGHQRAGVGDVEAVDILFGRDGLQHLVAVDVLGQRQLDQDAVDARVAVQRVDAAEQVGLGQVGRVAVEDGQEAVVFARLDLVAHVDLAGRVVADQDDGEAGLVAASGESGGALGGFGAELLGKRVAVDELGGHGRTEEGGKAKRDYKSPLRSSAAEVTRREPA